MRMYWKSIIWTGAILYASLIPSSGINTRLYFFEHQDKVIHICMYLMLSFFISLDISKSKQLQVRTYSIIFVSIIAFSCCIEIVQPIIANRTNEIADIAANGIGTALGLLVFYIKKR